MFQELDFLIIRGSVENSSGVFSANNFKLKSFITYVLGNKVGGSVFIVRVSGAPKFRGGWFEVESKAENLVSKNLQFANLALYNAPVNGSRYLMMDGESNPT